MRIASSGDIQFDTGKLHISSGTSGDCVLIIEADTDNNTEADNPYIEFRQDGGIGVSAIGHGLLSGDQNGLVIANSVTNGYISFATGSTNGHTNATERLRINSSGQLIMTNAATLTFADFSTTNNSTRGIISVAGKDGSGNAVTVKIGGFGDTSRGEIFTHSNHGLGFATNNASTQMVLGTNGCLSIGKTGSAGKAIEIYQASFAALRIQNSSTGTGGNDGILLEASGSDALLYNYESANLKLGTAGTERVRIDSTGRMLVSGTLGYGNMPFGGNPANAAIQIRCNSKYNGIAFGENAVSGAIGMGGADTTAAMVFVANAHPANLGGGTKDIFEWWSGTAGGGGPGKYMTLDTGGHLH